MRNLLFVFIAVLCFGEVNAQELNCQVIVNSRKLTNLDPQKFQTLRTDIFEFMNNRKWTDDEFDITERIECSININLEEEERTDRYRAIVTIQASRPVYNSSYKSVLLNHSDKDWIFDYTEFEPLEYSDNANLSNLTSMLAYYAYMIIGLDYDSFSLNGGTPYFTKAQTIVNNISSNSEFPGWSPIDGTRNRYWLVENIMNNRYSTFRNSYYSYHRLGLDRMYENMMEGRRSITTAITGLERITREYPNAMIIQSFFDAKSSENSRHLQRSKLQLRKARIIAKLAQMDPRNSGDYQELINQGGTNVQGDQFK